METSNTTSFAVCFNPNCKQTMDQPKKGWRLRSGGFTELCDRCGSAYEEGKFCETFHLNASGWRCCETCGKQIHCGCIVSFNMFVLLDAGGITCLTCARRRSILRIKDLSGKNWSPIAGSGPVPWRQAPRIFSGCIKSQEAKASFEFDAPSCADILHFEGQNNEDSVGQLLSGEKTCSPNILENRFSFARYLPRTTDQELLQICGENHIITPLFEKTLSASDAGPMGRLILPKKCVEVYLPSISRPEGLPLEVRDYKGNEWLFQLRFWLNNNSRMYVLEGVTPFIQSLELQAGDIVTFSRIEPGGKLIMGSRKASSTTSMYQGNEAVTTIGGISENGMNSKRCPKRTKKSIKRTGRHSTSISKPEEQIDTDFFNFTKGKNCILACKSTSLMIDNGYMIELKLNSKEAQGLIRPPPGNGPKVIVIEGFEIEEYEDAPIIGRPSSDYISKASFKKMKVSRLDPDSVKTSKELDGLANLAILEGGASLHATTRHPRHKPGCSCIVCMQPPSNGPKHKQSCVCAVCESVKRRFRTFMTRRREKKQLQKDATNATIDLNSQPERDKEMASGSDFFNVVHFMREPTGRHLEQQQHSCHTNVESLRGHAIHQQALPGGILSSCIAFDGSHERIAMDHHSALPGDIIATSSSTAQ